MRHPIAAILHRPRPNNARPAPRGQVLLLFAAMLTILLLASALVVDLGWLWSNALRIQRAADAAALAGVVHLPADVPGAYLTATNEADKNGYTAGGGVTVTPLRDPTIPRRLDVWVKAPVKTFFLGLIGMDIIDITRKAEADYVLPVPMGSPQNYYGVGDFLKISGGTTVTTPDQYPTGVDSGGAWSTTNGAYASGGTAATGSKNDQQVFKNFGLTVPAGYTIRGIEVQVRAKSTATKCQVGVELRAAGTYTTQQKTTADVDSSYTTYTLGGPTDTWGASWSPTDFSDGNFRLRLDAINPGSNCGDSDTWSVDFITVKVYSQVPVADQQVEVGGPSGALCTIVAPRTSCSQGFWGAVFTKGGVRQNGDRYSPAYYEGGSATANPDYDSGGYNYTVEADGGARVSLYDATFCGTGQTSFGGWYGAGDHWTGLPNPPGGTGYGGVTTRYRLYNTNGTEYNLADDTLVADSGSTFANENQTDQSGVLGSPQRTTANGASNCAANPYHDGWYALGGGLSAGKYRLNVNTSDPANNNIAAENLFSLQVSSGKVYGGGRMAAYTNLKAGTQRFYLAQVEAAHAGKTMDIVLFDPGDVSGDAYLRILSPDGNAYNYATFDYSADAKCVTLSDACSATGRTQIKTHGSSGSSFDNSVLTISVKLPSSYGSGGLTPSGETEAGWWKIEYQVAGGNDTTTWEVNIRGNPVRLVVP